MSASHHGNPEPRPQFSEGQIRQMEQLMDRIHRQVEGNAQRQYSQGRIGADDEGDLAIGIAADKDKQIVIIDFSKPVKWIGLAPKETNDLINLLLKKLKSLGHPVVLQA
jgi:hypothetical protein